MGNLESTLESKSEPSAEAVVVVQEGAYDGVGERGYGGEGEK